MVFYLVFLDGFFLCSGLPIEKHLGSIKGSKLEQRLIFIKSERRITIFLLSYTFLKKILAACCVIEVRAVMDLEMLCKPLNILSVFDHCERCVLLTCCFSVVADLNKQIKGVSKHWEKICLIKYF